MKSEKQSSNSLAFIISISVVALIAVIGLYLMLKPAPVDSAESLAKCLTEKGIKMYGSIYCPHCTAQKEIFGEAFQFINYVECTLPENSAVCSTLAGVPAWDINGEITYGSQEIEELKELSGC